MSATPHAGADRQQRLTTRPSVAAHPPDRLGPIATWLGQAHLVGSLVYAFGVIYQRLPPASSWLLLLLALGCAVLAPPGARQRLRVSLPFAALLGWMLLSWTWSVNPDETWSRVSTQLPMLLSVVVVTGLLDRSAVAAALRWSIRLALLLVVLVLLTDPGSRTSGDSEFEVAGWRGGFPDKNSLGLYLVFALAVTLTLDRGASRLCTSLAIGGLLLGAQSATSWTAAALVLLVWRWLVLWRRQLGRQSAVFVLASIGLVLCAAAAVSANVTALLEVYGKDADLTGRTEIWSGVLQAVADRPAIGYGLGALLNPEAPSSETLELWHVIGFHAAHAHNGALDLMGQLGVVGLGLYLLTLWATWRAAGRQLRQDPGPATLAVVMLSAVLVMSVSENVFLGPWLLVLAVLQGPLLLPTPAPSGEVRRP